jgi:hypothetical protein
VYTQIEKFIMGSVLGLLVPISLVWAQYVHPLNFPKIPQIEQISSDYLLNIPLENALEELEQDSEWIKLKEEAFHSDYEMQSTNLNGLNSSYEDFGMLDEFKNAEISISSIQLEKPLFKPFGKSSYPESDHTFALTNLIKSSLKHTTTPPINNPIDTIWIESSHQEDISGEIETYPSPTSVFIRNSPVKHIANHGMTPGESSNKQTTETLSYNEVLTSYTQYSGITSPSPLVYYNIFETDALEIFTTYDSPFQIDSDLSGSESMGTPSLRQRRTSHNYDSANAYDWEINDFNGSSASNDLPLQFNTNSVIDANSSTPFKLNVIAKDGIDSLAVLAWGHIGGNALIDFADASGFKFLTHDKNDTSLTTGNVSSSFEIRVTDAATGQTGIDSWLNDPDWHNWGVYAKDTGNTREFFLTYDYNPLNYSAVPEPSTYFMTGALFCLIGCNRSSRNVFNSIVSKAFNHWKTKPKCLDIQKRIS